MLRVSAGKSVSGEMSPLRPPSSVGRYWMLLGVVDEDSRSPSSRGIALDTFSSALEIGPLLVATASTT